MAPRTRRRTEYVQYVDHSSMKDLIRESLVAERIAIESYREIAQSIGGTDPTTRCLMESTFAPGEE